MDRVVFDAANWICEAYLTRFLCLMYSELVGLALSYGLSLNVLLYWTVWLACNLENKMVSVERIHQFTKIPSEAPLVVQECRPAANWPSTGNIEINNLQVSYSSVHAKTWAGS